MYTASRCIMGWKAGASRQEVTSWEEGIYLFGWGNPNNKALGVATPLYARALVLDDGTTPIALVLVDIGVITYTIRRFTLQALRDAFPDCPIRDEHILLTATHTHSAASGYSEYLFYGLSGPGVSQTIVNTYAQGIAKAIGTAWRDREPASVRVGEDDLPLSIPVAFNRSLTPYQQNAEYRDRNDLQSDEATWRRMTLLRVDSLTRKAPLAVFSWFATHATSVHANHTEIHGDNVALRPSITTNSSTSAMATASSQPLRKNPQAISPPTFDGTRRAKSTSAPKRMTTTAHSSSPMHCATSPTISSQTKIACARYLLPSRAIWPMCALLATSSKTHTAKNWKSATLSSA